MRVAVTGLGLVCALGERLDEVAARLAAGASGVTRLDRPGLPDARGGAAPGPDLKPWLLRRKDAKLLPRAAALALPAAGRALAGWDGPREDLGLYFGVRREPSGGDVAAPALVAAGDGAGGLDVRRLAELGRPLYPPLLPVTLLPNMILAHVSINLGVMGPNDTLTGEAAAGLSAVRAGALAVLEGRCPAALVGAADSPIDGDTLRDQARLGDPRPPGEAAVVLRIEPPDTPGARFLIELGEVGFDPDPAEAHPARAHHAALGACGVADGLLALLLGGPGEVTARDADGARASLRRVA